MLRTPEGRAAVGIPETERVLGLVHLGRAKGPDKAAPERAPLDEFRTYLPSGPPATSPGSATPITARRRPRPSKYQGYSFGLRPCLAAPAIVPSGLSRETH